MENKESVFRKKTLDRVNSPEDLDKYLKVTNPSIWIFLIAIVSVLLGFIIWGTVGKIEGYINTGCVIKEGLYECYIDEDDISRISNDNILKINDKEFSINLDNAEYIYENADAYLIKLGQINSSSVFKLTGSANLSNGYYAGKIIVEEISPISFILN